MPCDQHICDCEEKIALLRDAHNLAIERSHELELENEKLRYTILQLKELYNGKRTK